ncbi:MAG TPA: HDOD domain-containing protein [Dongiaceae bacterium]|jgi:putative nucleotidyltransferase with HDIG domain|nr:HDOD domain-containing protein [Dongiaceae bacterium]
MSEPMTAAMMVARARNLPQIPATALKLIGLLDEPDCNNDELAGLVQGDPALTAKLLRACNSSALALSEPVSSVDQALLILGYGAVANMVMSLAMSQAMRSHSGYSIPVEDLWQHALTTAAAAKTMVDQGLYEEHDAAVAYTAGLLHDVGKLVMAQVLGAEVHAAIRQHRVAEGLGSVAAEREVLGTDHTEVGACLLHVWRLPEWIVEATGNHHRPVLGVVPHLSAVVHVANRVAHLVDTPNSGDYAINETDAVALAFGLHTRRQQALLTATAQAATQARGILVAA